MMLQSENIELLSADLCKAQAELEGAKKDSSNPFYKSYYADLASSWDALREPLTRHGFSVTQTTNYKDGIVFLITTLRHKSGQWIAGVYPLKPQKDDPQGWGSAISYARRYMLAAITGLYQADDDAESAMQRSKIEPIKKEIQTSPKDAPKGQKIPFNDFTDSLSSRAFYQDLKREPFSRDKIKPISERQVKLLIARSIHNGWSKENLEEFFKNRFKCGLAELPATLMTEALNFVQMKFSDAMKKASELPF